MRRAAVVVLAATVALPSARAERSDVLDVGFGAGLGRSGRMGPFGGSDGWDTVAAIGGGIGLGLTQHFGLRVEAEASEKGKKKESAKFVGVGVLWRVNWNGSVRALLGGAHTVSGYGESGDFDVWTLAGAIEYSIRASGGPNAWIDVFGRLEYMFGRDASGQNYESLASPQWFVGLRFGFDVVHKTP